MYHLKQIPSETQIRKYIRRIVFGKNIFCPVCRTREVISSQERYWCKKCRKRFSLLSDTWLRDCKIPWQRFWLVLWCWTKQIPVKQTQNLVEMSEKGIRHWYDLFRQNLPKDQEVLEAIVQLDEAYFGGWRGRALFLAKQQGTRRLAYQILPHNQPNKYEAILFVKAYLKSKSTLQTDGSVIYQGIGKYAGIQHLAENHNRFEFQYTAEIEGMFGVLRTFIRRMYHHVTPEKLDGYMCEFYYRFSHPEIFQSPRYFLSKTLRLVPSG